MVTCVRNRLENKVRWDPAELRPWQRRRVVTVSTVSCDTPHRRGWLYEAFSPCHQSPETAVTGLEKYHLESWRNTIWFLTAMRRIGFETHQ